MIPTNQVPVIDASKVFCPCCGEDTWCPEEKARTAMDAARAPELVIGTATYGGRWSR